jgi:hypothetical protein
MLFRHFIENLSPSFDMCDPAKQFGTTVPRRAATCPPLMNAILASSAKRWSRDRKLDTLTGNRYHQKCLDALIPALSNTAALLDENLLAAIVILRYMEEVDVPIGDTSFESHLLGTRIFIAAQDKLHDFTSGSHSGRRLSRHLYRHGPCTQTLPLTTWRASSSCPRTMTAASRTSR